MTSHQAYLRMGSPSTTSKEDRDLQTLEENVQIRFAAHAARTNLKDTPDPDLRRLWRPQPSRPKYVSADCKNTQFVRQRKTLSRPHCNPHSAGPLRPVHDTYRCAQTSSSDASRRPPPSQTVHTQPSSVTCEYGPKHEALVADAKGWALLGSTFSKLLLACFQTRHRQHQRG